MTGEALRLGDGETTPAEPDADANADAGTTIAIGDELVAIGGAIVATGDAAEEAGARGNRAAAARMSARALRLLEQAPRPVDVVLRRPAAAPTCALGPAADPALAPVSASASAPAAASPSRAAIRSRCTPLPHAAGTSFSSYCQRD